MSRGDHSSDFRSARVERYHPQPSRKGQVRQAARYRTFGSDWYSGCAQHSGYHGLAAEHGYQSPVFQLRRKLADYAARADGTCALNLAYG